MKALIVDDEAHVRAAIRLLVDWKQYGISHIDEASDGEQAIACIKEAKPQIIITDMMMPNVSGMKLMEWVSANSPDSKLIAISGHGDFNLVRHTLKHGGIDYILKPIEQDAVNEAIAKAVTAWIKDEEERSTRYSQQIQMNEFKPVITEKLWSSLIDDPIAQSAVVRRLQQTFGLAADITQLRMALVFVESTDEKFKQKFGNNSDLLYFSLVNIMEEYVNRGTKRGAVFRHWNAPGEIVIVMWLQSDALEAVLQDINEALHITMHRRLHFGLSSIHAFPEGMPQCYADTKRALNLRNLLLPGRYLHNAPTVDVKAEEHLSVSGADAASPEYTKSIRMAAYEESWKLAVLSGSAEEISAAIKPFIASIKTASSISPRQIRDCYREWETMRANIAHEAVGDAAELLLRDNPALTDRDAAITAAPFSLEAWQQLWQRELTVLADACFAQQGQEQHIIFDIAKYVEQHYHEELSLQDMATRFYVSREYISRKFKQQFGINLSDYLTSIRTEKAKLLLLNPHLRISQVAAMVGIQDEKYFSKVFKKQVGVSPNEYRKSKQV
ncbi:response regulator [Paenibacillus sp. ACRRX]|uniref:response regulator transcription factor n=1 Tax=Paenibacillus sp. ACRRX TaxID=2918206 RepID=UPI001EF5FB80|nr:response regulator [Paenibacillus sp. ACRRX]MCG7408645.1 response regulator [Paenibacillus sp. ACRRX]